MNFPESFRGSSENPLNASFLNTQTQLLSTPSYVQCCGATRVTQGPCRSTEPPCAAEAHLAVAVVKFTPTENGVSGESSPAASFFSLLLYHPESEQSGQTCPTRWVHSLPAALILCVISVTQDEVFLDIQSNKPFCISTNDVISASS